jgi:hypothetical protein
VSVQQLDICRYASLVFDDTELGASGAVVLTREMTKIAVFALTWSMQVGDVVSP